MGRRRPPNSRLQSSDRQAESASQVRAFVRYLDAECGLAFNTVEAYRRDLARFVQWLRDTNGPSLVGLSIGTLSSYLEYLRDEGQAASSAARSLVAIKMMLRYLQLEGLVADNAADLLASPKLWKKLPTVLSPEAVDRLLEAPVPKHDRLWRRDRAILSTMYATGCRASECCDLRQGDVRLAVRTALLRGKGNKERQVTLNPRAVAAIVEYLDEQRATLARGASDRLFLSRTGGPLSRIALWELVKKYAVRIGAPASFSPHSLRHSFATHMLAGGAEIRALQEMLGHANIRTTQIYTQVDSTRMRAVHQSCHPRA